MTVLMVMLLFGIFVELLAFFYVMVQAVNKVDKLSDEVRQLRLTSRARVRRASMQSGATTDEQVLSRLGRASVGRRVVIGGDDDSVLSGQLRRGSGIKDE